jgi:hypothetical protein
MANCLSRSVCQPLNQFDLPSWSEINGELSWHIFWLGKLRSICETTRQKLREEFLK